MTFKKLTKKYGCKAVLAWIRNRVSISNDFFDDKNTLKHVKNYAKSELGWLVNENWGLSRANEALNKFNIDHNCHC